MTYKEFVDWCNERACDGCWSRDTAICCINIVRHIRHLPFWKRKKEWLRIKDEVERGIVSVINEKIQALKGGAE